MAARPEQLLRHIRRLVPRPASDPASDAALLRRFVCQRDEDAFAALVSRHGPLVLGVCRRVLRDPHEAEEASQAVWLVLARKAATVRPPSRLAAWLHGVARHLALNARRAGARRRRHEAPGPHAEPAASPADPLDELTARELLALLDEELQRLPEAYRLPLILCALEGRTVEEAARQLGWTAGSVRGRLIRGRARLHARLVRRGLALPAALAAVEAARGLAPAAVPAGVAGQVARAAAAFAVGQPAAALSNRAAALAQSALEGMVMAKPKVGLVLALAAGLALVAAGVAQQVLSAGQPQGGESAEPEPAPPEKERPAHTDLHGDPLPEGAVARLGTVRFNHGNGLNSLFFSPDGKTILSHGGGLVRLWDAATGRQLAQFSVPKRWADDQAGLTPDGKSLVLLAQEFPSDVLSVWDLTRGKEVRSAKLPVRRGEVSVTRRNAISPDGRLCALHTPEEKRGGQRTPEEVRVFEVATAKELCRLPTEGRELQAAVFGGNDRIVTADKKGTIEVWEAQTGKPVRQFAHGSPAVVMAASSDGAWLATLEHHTYAIDRFLDKDVIHVWDLATGTRKHTLTSRPSRWFMGVCFSPDGKHLLASSFGETAYEVSAWEVATGKRVCELDGAVGMALAVSPDGGRAAAGGSLGKFDLWDLKAGRRLSPDDSQHSAAATVFLSPAGDLAFTVGPSSISTWDGTTGRRLHSFDVPACPYGGLRLVHSPDGRYAVSFAHDPDTKRLEILVWDVVARRRLHTLPVPGGPYEIGSAFSPDSSLLAVWHPGKEAGEGVVRLWDVRTGNEVRSLRETKAGLCKRVSFAADGKALLIVGRSVVGLDAVSGKELFTWQTEPSKGREAVGAAEDGDPWRAAAISPDASVVAGILSAGGFNRGRLEDRLVLCDARTGKVLSRYNDSGLPSNGYEALEFSPDGRLLASSDGEAVHVWEVVTGQEVYTFRGHRGEVRSLAFSANGRRLASSSTDSTAVLWDLTGKSGAAAVPAAEPGEKEVAGWWADLAGEDARRAQAAVWRLAEAPAASVPFLRQRLRPVTDAQMKQTRQHIADLDSETFAVRQKAFEQLQGLGRAAAPALREALKQGVSAEVRRCVEELLGSAGKPPTGEPLRVLRALAALEHADAPEARRLLRELADGAPGAWLTQEAKAVSARQSSGRGLAAPDGR
jgi:RNA polymerase sigma factor (sigma-70 family)